MPSSATITSFYNFSANTKARASQVNNNFDVFRGHIIPVEPLTATSADNTYDLGDFSHRWRYGYFGQTRYGTTSSAYGSIYLDSATTASELILSLNGAEKARINTNGLKRNSVESNGWNTTYLASGFLSFNTSAATTFAILSITSQGRPIKFGLNPASLATIGTTGSTNIGGKINIQGTTSTSFPTAHFLICRDTTTAIVYDTTFRIVASDFSGSKQLEMPSSAIQGYDFSVTAGGHTYLFRAYCDRNTTTGSGVSAEIWYSDFFCYEVI